MTDTAITDFSESFNHMTAQVSQLESVLTRTVQALAKVGVQLSVDLDGMMQNVRQDIGMVQKQSRRVVEQLDQLQELVRTVALITSSLELDEVLAEVMDTVIHLTGAERAYLMLRNNDTGELTIRAARNWDRETMSEDDVVFSSSIVNEAIAGKEPIVATNAQGDARFQAMKSVVQHGLRSIMCIPLVMHGNVVGVLYADNRIDQGVFNQRNVPILTAFGTQAAIAIENARLFTRVRNDLREAQQELRHLQIQIDQQKLAQQVSEITDSEYFDRLTEAARIVRQRRNRE